MGKKGEQYWGKERTERKKRGVDATICNVINDLEISWDLDSSKICSDLET